MTKPSNPHHPQCVCRQCRPTSAPVESPEAVAASIAAATRACSRAVDAIQALERLKRAAMVVANVLDAGQRDPTWHESQELEAAAIAYGRAVRAKKNGD